MLAHKLIHFLRLTTATSHQLRYNQGRLPTVLQLLQCPLVVIEVASQGVTTVHLKKILAMVVTIQPQSSSAT